MGGEPLKEYATDEELLLGGLLPTRQLYLQVCKGAEAEWFGRGKLEDFPGSD